MRILNSVGLFALFVMACTSTATHAAERIPSGEVVVGPNTDSARLTMKSDPEAYKLLPARILDAGKIIVGLESNAGYPNSVTINGVNYGLTVDLGRALAAVLGIKFEGVTMPFSNIIPALGSGRIDMTSALVTDTAKRRQAVDFVDTSYSLANMFLLQDKSPLKSITYETACGHVVGANTGSQQASRLAVLSQQCTQEGKPPIDVKLFPNNAETVLAVQSGRLEAALSNAGQVKYLLRTNPQGLRAGSEKQSEKVGLVALAFPKGSDLVPAFRQAMLSLYRSGAWKEILTQYNFAEAFPPEAVIMNTEPLPVDNLPAKFLQ